MDIQLFEQKRKSYIQIGEIYFWTATINSWMKLLDKDQFKQVILDSLSHLSEKGKIDVFAFVIMPNHIHLIWRINELNGKEEAHISFLKFTAHQFKTMLLKEGGDSLEAYKVNANNKEYEFWQRDSLAIPLFSRTVAFQKLNYLHNNPMAKHWQLAVTPADYLYSSAKYYEGGETSYTFLKDLREEF